MKSFGGNDRFRRAFTLIEILVVIAVIGVLATLIFPVLSGSSEKARILKSKNNLSQIAKAALTYGSVNGGRTLPHAIFDLEINENREWSFGYFQDGSNPFRNGLLGPYLGSDGSVLVCPLFDPDPEVQAQLAKFGKPGNLGYGHNGLNLSRLIPAKSAPGGQGGHYVGIPYSRIRNPARTVMFATSAMDFGGKAAPQDMIWGPDHLGGVPCVRLVNQNQAIVAWADGSVELVNAIPKGEPLADGTQLGYLDPDGDGVPDLNIWKP